MERLFEASWSGDVNTLKEVLEKDRHILDRVILTCFNETPLHISVMYGHVEFTREILRKKHELIMELNSEGLSPFHLASARNNIQMVQLLLEFNNSDVCTTILDHAGRTPLHLAAIKGHVNIMRELINKGPKAIQVRLDRKETILHLCVKHNRLESLKVLVEYLPVAGSSVSSGADEEEESVVSINSKDEDGNTILHLAASRRQMKMITYLMKSNIGVDINTLNKKGLTALHMLAQGDHRRDDSEIGDEQKQQAPSNHNKHQDQTVVDVINQSDSYQRINRIASNANDDQYTKWLDNNRNIFMLVASLIAAMAFQAGFNPPGGVWQEDTKLKSDEEPVLFLYYLRKLQLRGGHLKPNDPKIAGVKDFITALESSIGSSNMINPSGIVSKEGEWKNIISNHTGFFPYLVRYAGTPVFAYNNPKDYETFVILNMIGFLASMSIILLLVTKSPTIDQKLLSSRIQPLRWLMYVAVLCVTLSYAFALSCMFPPFVTAPESVLNTSIHVWAGVMCFFFLFTPNRFFRLMVLLLLPHQVGKSLNGTNTERSIIYWS